MQPTIHKLYDRQYAQFSINLNIDKRAFGANTPSRNENYFAQTNDIQRFQS